MLGWRLGQLLKRENKPPDVAFIGYPLIEIAAVMTKWLAKKNVRCTLDVKDQWPTIFIDALPKLLQPVGTTSRQELDDAGRWWGEQGIQADRTSRFIFVGSHSVAFDVNSICAAAKLLQHQETPVQFAICGDGLKSKLWREKALAGVQCILKNINAPADIIVLAERKQALTPRPPCVAVTESSPRGTAIRLLEGSVVQLIFCALQPVRLIFQCV